MSTWHPSGGLGPCEPFLRQLEAAEHQARWIAAMQRGGRCTGEAAEVDDHIIDHGEQHARVVPLRLVGLKRRQNVRFSISETRDRAAAVRLEYRNGTMLKNMETTWGRVSVQKARSGRPRAQTGESPSSRLE